MSSRSKSIRFWHVYIAENGPEPIVYALNSIEQVKCKTNLTEFEWRSRCIQTQFKFIVSIRVFALIISEEEKRSCFVVVVVSCHFSMQITNNFIFLFVCLPFSNFLPLFPCAFYESFHWFDNSISIVGFAHYRTTCIHNVIFICELCHCALTAKFIYNRVFVLLFSSFYFSPQRARMTFE